jgi:hypothetical protein
VQAVWRHDPDAAIQAGLLWGGLGTSKLHLLFASKNVDDFVAAQAHDFNKDQQRLT